MIQRRKSFNAGPGAVDYNHYVIKIEPIFGVGTLHRRPEPCAVPANSLRCTGKPKHEAWSNCCKSPLHEKGKTRGMFKTL
jgi:hypothetical protein